VLSRKLSVCRHRSASRTRPFSHRTSSRDPAGEGSLRRDDESYTKIREFINIVQLSRGYILSSSEPSSPLIEEWIRCLRWHDCHIIQGISIGTQNCLLSRSKTAPTLLPLCSIRLVSNCHLAKNACLTRKTEACRVLCQQLIFGISSWSCRSTQQFNFASSAVSISVAIPEFSCIIRFNQISSVFTT
jgi:hypothetical protein